MKLQSFTGQPESISHSFLAIAEHLSDFPHTKLWLRKQAIHEKIDKKAKNYIQSIVKR
jgi:hypothetical protein